MKYLLLFHCSCDYTKAPQCYVCFVFMFIMWIILAQNVCERAKPLCFDVSVVRIQVVTANNSVNAIVRHEVLRRYSVGIAPNLGRYLVRSSVLVSQLQAWFSHWLVCIHNCRRCCSLTLAACWTTRYMKECLSCNPLAFAHVPADVTASELCEDSIFGNSVWHCVYKICGFIFVKKLATRLCCGRFPPKEI